jgi:hypothetical protein
MPTLTVATKGALANPIAATTADDGTTTANHADSWKTEGVQAW